MKIHAFKLHSEPDSAPLEEVLEFIQSESKLDKRIRIVNRASLRVDSIECRDGLWYMNFVKFRESQGPGKGKKKAVTEGFDFKKGESFAEETAALYDPATGYMLVQYNHSGVRSASIAVYLSKYDEDAANIYDLNPKYDPDTERKLQQQAIKKSLSFKIDVSKMTSDDLKNGVALSKAVEFGSGCNAGVIDIEISAGSRKGRLKGQINNLLDNLLSLARERPEAVKSVKIGGKESDDAAVEVLDLLAERLYVEYSDIKPGLDLRLPLEDRWQGLLKARNRWKRILTRA